jgi:hypothetical protein
VQFRTGGAEIVDATVLRATEFPKTVHNINQNDPENNSRQYISQKPGPAK